MPMVFFEGGVREQDESFLSDGQVRRYADAFVAAGA